MTTEQANTIVTPGALGAAVGNGLSPLGAASLGAFVFLFMVASYPAVRRWFGRRGDVPFTRWVLTAAVTSVAAAAAGHLFGHG